MKTVRNGGNPPTLKRYRNLRNSISNYFGTKAANTDATFDLDLGVPVGVLYPDVHGEKAADNHRYGLPVPSDGIRQHCDSWRSCGRR